jgi:predicted O-methyltransferase YrrM
MAACLAAEHKTGLAPFYPLLHVCVLGLKAKQVLEFGSGLSSSVLVDALYHTGGRLVSIDPAPKGQLPVATEPWELWQQPSDTVRERIATLPPLDLVLHDGSHSTEVVAEDLARVLPRMKRGGLILIHDTLHSYVGPAMREGMTRALEGLDHEADVARVTLPFGFGLTIWQLMHDVGHGHVAGRGLDKPSSAHHTTEMPA